MTDKAHSEIGASSSSRWINCPGSVRMCRDVPNESSAFADEGTKAHAMAEAFLKTNSMPEGADLEIAEAIAPYIAYACDLIKRSGIRVIEARVSAPSIDEEMFGTVDLLTVEGDTLHVVDLKFGAGLRVEVNNNKQLLYYAVCALDEYVVAMAGINTVRCTIVQPRLGEDAVRSVDYTRAEVESAREAFKIAILATRHPQAPLCAGSWCQFCRAAFKCPSLLAKVLAVDPGNYASEDRPSDNDPDLIASLLTAAETAEFFIRRIRERAFNYALTGGSVPGYTLTDTRPTRSWSDQDQVLEAILRAGIALPEDQRIAPEELIEAKLKSPAQVETLLKRRKQLQASLKAPLAELTVKASSGKKLVRITSKPPKSSADGYQNLEDFNTEE